MKWSVSGSTLTNDIEECSDRNVSCDAILYYCKYRKPIIKQQIVQGGTNSIEECSTNILSGDNLTNKIEECSNEIVSRDTLTNKIEECFSEIAIGTANSIELSNIR